MLGCPVPGRTPPSEQLAADIEGQVLNHCVVVIVSRPPMSGSRDGQDGQDRGEQSLADIEHDADHHAGQLAAQQHGHREAEWAAFQQHEGAAPDGAGTASPGCCSPNGLPTGTARDAPDQYGEEDPERQTTISRPTTARSRSRWPWPARSGRDPRRARSTTRMIPQLQSAPADCRRIGDREVAAEHEHQHVDEPGRRTGSPACLQAAPSPGPAGRA